MTETRIEKQERLEAAYQDATDLVDAVLWNWVEDREIAGLTLTEDEAIAIVHRIMKRIVRC